MVQFVRHGENGLQKLRVAGEGSVDGILERGLLPWVASTCEVYQDDTEAPDIIGGAEVGRLVCGVLFQAF